MPQKSKEKFISPERGVLRSYVPAAVCVALALIMSKGVIYDLRFSAFSEFLIIPLGIIWLGLGSALFGLRGWQQTHHIKWMVCVVPFVGVSLRYWIPAVTDPMPPPVLYPTPEETRVKTFLRYLISEQEEIRLRQGVYASGQSRAVTQLQARSAVSKLQLTAKGDSSWHALAEAGKVRCEVYVGLNAGLGISGQAEGVPRCNTSRRTGAHQVVSGARFSGQALREAVPFSHDTGTWPQHRFDATRTGIAPGAHARTRWDHFVSGEIRSSASVSNGMIYVGAHGNGEIAALRLTDGQIVWRARAPNWIHHEPVISTNLIVYGFGNNETFRPDLAGTPPSGYEARDKRTGRLIWRRTTGSTAMGAPALFGGMVIAREREQLVHAWDLLDGTERWSVRLPLGTYGPMTNPLLIDSVVFVTSEPASWCALHAETGKILRCGEFSDAEWGGGHSSPAFFENILLFTFIDRKPRPFLNFLTGFLRESDREANGFQSVSVVAVDWRSGDIMWRTRILGRNHPVAGHIAGTPVVNDGQIFVPLPTIGRVVALDLVSGKIQWNVPANPARGSVTLFQGNVFLTTAKGQALALDKRTGRTVCVSALPSPVDRAGLSVRGNTGVLTFLNGQVSVAPMQSWMSCNVW